MPQDIDKMMGLTFPARNINIVDKCPACEGSGHEVLNAEIKAIYDPSRGDMPYYKLDLRVEHCIHCRGTGVIEQHVNQMSEPIYDRKIQDGINSRPDCTCHLPQVHGHIETDCPHHKGETNE